MKEFTLNNFIAEDYKIPNANEDIRIVKERIKWRNDDFPCITIYYKGHKILTFGESWRYHYVPFHDEAKAVELGLLTRDTAGGIVFSIIDALYYKANPPRIRSVKGAKRVLATAWKALRIRVDHGRCENSFVTKLILNECIKDLEDRYNKPEHPKGSDNYNELVDRELNLNTGGEVRVCLISGIIGYRHQFRHYRGFENISVAVHHDVEIEDFGYTVVDGRFLLGQNEYVFRDRVYSRLDGQMTCPQCNHEVPTTAIDSDEGICIDCVESRYKVHPYSTKVPDLLKFKAKNVKPKESPLYMGCELEYETIGKKEAQIKVGKLLSGHAIMKSDGSIRNGFEIVTCPATIDIHLEEFSKFFNPLPTELITASNVGMHVHVSKKPLTLFTVGKLTAFMNRQANKKFIEFVAGRTMNHYCNLDPQRTVTFPWTNKSSQRYNTLNLNNKETIEFRIFSTPKTFDEFASKLQFCKALVDYAMPANLDLPLSQITNYESFIKWVVGNAKSYPQLVSKIKEFA